jgi:hypothetical protein
MKRIQEFKSRIPLSTYKNYEDKIRTFLGKVPIYSPGYAATEGVFCVNLDPAAQHYTFIPGTGFFEFLPASPAGGENPQVHDITDLKIGEEYELVLTNYSGFYRYRMGDIIKIEKYINQTPVFSFIRRKGVLIDIAAEKTTEEAVSSALKACYSAIGLEILDYIIYPECRQIPGYYDFYIELRKHPVPQQTIPLFTHRLEKELQSANPRYHAARKKNKIGPTKVTPLHPGTFLKYKKKQEKQEGLP